MYAESLVYLNKVYSNLKIPSCPLVTDIRTTPEEYDQQLIFYEPREDDCGCGQSCCCRRQFNCRPDPDCMDDMTFNIESTEVLFSDFDLSCPEHLDPEHVTVDGIPVDDIDYFNRRYMASTNELMTKVSDCCCMERGLSTKAYLLLRNLYGWRAKVTLVLRGEVYGCGICKRFKLIMKPKKNTEVCISGPTTFATPSLCLPCTTGGISPIINFSFKAKGTLLNPSVAQADVVENCAFEVSGCLVTEPVLYLQVTRQTLFRTDAEKLNIPCDDIEKCSRAFDGCADDDSGAYSLRERCCTEERRGGKGCPAPKEREEKREGDSKNTACQFNGLNGFHF